MKNKLVLAAAVSPFLGFLFFGAAAVAADDPPPRITVNQIIRGEGKVGDVATSKNGEVIYEVLAGGIIEVRNTRYKTAHRYGVVKPNDNSRNN
ncbi:hypothetical protein [Phyllobacterium bourgognense]|uniref:hypothetical protein n=1 Tax=Phyllobacterium bourgognense TaxID=314236 RepID=UPI000DF44593|nr:hypothetical protein [Phyllobacterium bourgognense]